jgi:hypothetical protein
MHALALAVVLSALEPAALPPAHQAAGPLKPSAAPPPARDDAHRGVDALLGMRGAVSDERWRKLGPQAVPVLEQIARDPKALPTRRARALEGLVALRSAGAPALIEKLSQSEETPFVVRLAAVRGAGRALDPQQQLSALRPTLQKASDPHLRVAAAEVLARHADGCAAVREQAGRETAAARPSFDAALRRCASR